MKNELEVLKELLSKRLHAQNKLKFKTGLSIDYIAIENFNLGLKAAIDYIETGKFKGHRSHE